MSSREIKDWETNPPRGISDSRRLALGIAMAEVANGRIIGVEDVTGRPPEERPKLVVPEFNPHGPEAGYWDQPGLAGA